MKSAILELRILMRILFGGRFEQLILLLQQFLNLNFKDEMKKVVLISLAFVLAVSSFASKKGKRIPMRKSTKSVFGCVKSKRSLGRMSLEFYQDGDVLYIDTLNGACAFVVLKNEDGEIVSSFVTYGDEEVEIPKGAAIIEATFNGVSFCGILY